MPSQCHMFVNIYFYDNIEEDLYLKDLYVYIYFLHYKDIVLFNA